MRRWPGFRLSIPPWVNICPVDTDRQAPGKGSMHCTLYISASPELVLVASSKFRKFALEGIGKCGLELAVSNLNKGSLQ